MQQILQIARATVAKMIGRYDMLLGGGEGLPGVYGTLKSTRAMSLVGCTGKLCDLT